MAMTNIPAGNNIIYTGSNKRETVLFGAERIDVGVNTGETEIVKDKESGFNVEQDKIISKTVYDLRKQKRKRFFVLDLETGARGNNTYFPGCIRVTKTTATGHEVLYAAKNEGSAVVFPLFMDGKVKIIDIEYGDTEEDIWYKLDLIDANGNLTGIIGYMRNTYIDQDSIHFEAPKF